MSLFSKQKFYCNACGKEINKAVEDPYGITVCGKECYEEIEWRRVLSIHGKEYYPRPVKE